ncbi:hypothetical protein, partial [Cardiobacterium hominis]|uniref:hypothetical protein n=1 Tax=Cardiobacterium hominis TaxID=2718 RepID=UPI0028E46368
DERGVGVRAASVKNRNFDLSIIFIRFFLKENFQRTHTDWQRSHETRHHDRVEQVGPQTSYFSTYFYDVSY